MINSNEAELFSSLEEVSDDGKVPRKLTFLCISGIANLSFSYTPPLPFPTFAYRLIERPKLIAISSLCRKSELRARDQLSF